MRRALFFLAMVAAGWNAAAQIQIFESDVWPDIRVAAQKPNGQLTAAGVGGSWRAWNWNEHWQPAYNNSPWNAWGSGDTVGVPVSMEEAANGTVISVWDKKEDGSVYCLVHEDFSALARLYGLRGPASGVRVFLDSRTNFWATESGLNISTANGHSRAYHQTPKPVHTITTDELWPQGDVKNRLPVSITEDARGRIWFWSNCLLGNDSQGSIHGVLICDDGVVTNRVKLDGVDEGRISVIVPMNDSNLWLAVRDVGIFSVNPDTLAGVRVAEPERGAFTTVQNIFSANGDRYVIAGAPWSPLTNGLRTVLWRERDGHWIKLVNGLDGEFPIQPADRRWRVTKDGLWLGSFGLGGWFVPFDERPAQVINWQKNSPFETINRWFQLKDGQMLGIQFGSGGLLADAALLAQKPAVVPTAQVLITAFPPVRTTDGKVFCVLRGDEFSLAEWEGKRWQHHPLPDKLQLWGSCKMSADSLGRLWLAEANYNPDPGLIAAFIYDPASARFQKFQNLRAALQSEIAAHPGLHLDKFGALAVDFSRDGRICLESEQRWRIEYFDGHKWHSWNRNNEIMKGEYLQSGQENSPFFAKDGKLSIKLNRRLWQFDDLSGWKKSETDAEDARPELAEMNDVVARPDLPGAESVVVGNAGIFWAVVDHRLFRAGHRQRVACFAPNEPQPFADGRRLLGAFTDRYGSAFLRTGLRSGREEFVLIPPHAPPPVASVKLLENGADGAVVEFASEIPTALFSWRADDGAWNNATTNRTVRLEELTAGPHKIQVIALDEQLQASAVPAELKLESHSDPAQSVQKWMAQLGEKDFARREAAVKNLSRHAAAALPALRAAREKETDADRRWWLDAAIQQCEK